MLVVVMVFVSLIKEDLFQVIHQCGRSGSNLTHLPHLLIIHVNLHHIHIYFRFRHHQWDLLIHSSVLITHPVQAVFQYGTGRERGEGNKRTKGGGERWRERGRQGSRKTAFYFRDLFFALQHADKNSVGIWTNFQNILAY